MKMVLAIINYDDSQDVISSLMKAGFSITKLATTGGFLKAGNVTILIGLDESKLDECFDIIRVHSSSRNLRNGNAIFGCSEVFSVRYS